MEKEIWKDVVGYEGLYEVSNFGKVKSAKRCGSKGEILATSMSSGYYRVNLSNGKCKKFLVHRLVAKSFLENPNGLPQINHKDLCKTNNILSNLEWCSRSENMRHRHNLRPINHSRYWEGKTGEKYHLSKPVLQLDKNGNELKKWPSITLAQNELGLKHISCVCLGKRNMSGGYLWKYA